MGERLRERIEQTVTATKRGAVGVTISVGVAILEHESNELASLLCLADKALYEAKQAGRNRVASQPSRSLEV